MMVAPVHKDENYRELQVQCPICGTITKVLVEQGRWIEYLCSDKPIQIVFPHMDVYDREALINGVCRECSKKLI